LEGLETRDGFLKLFSHPTLLSLGRVWVSSQPASPFRYLVYARIVRMHLKMEHWQSMEAKDVKERKIGHHRRISGRA
jgi:hypothetical protein